MKLNLMCADIGGTSSRFGHFVVLPEHKQPQFVSSTWLETESETSFIDLLLKLEQTSFSLAVHSIDVFVIAAAGPISRGGKYCSPPNIRWNIDLDEVQEKFSIKRAALINDFLAQAYACKSDVGKRARVIIPGEPISDSAIAVIGAGTGLGKAILSPNGKGGYFGLPSEGGHVNIAVEDSRELEFQNFVARKEQGYYATWDDVVSGRGVTYIHEFLTGEKLTAESVAESFSPDSPTLEWAARFYGRACRNFALEMLALGGIYICGGIAAKNPVLVTCSAFRDAFYNSHVHEQLLRQIPVYLIDDQESGLWGAAHYGQRLLDD